MSVFVDVNVIQSIPPSCVNRDDTGSPKTAVYGGVRRARVSSQCWKSAMRKMFRERFDENELGFRTKKIYDLVATKIKQKDGSITDEDAMSRAVSILNIGGIKPAKEKKNQKNANPEAPALFFISTKQIDALADLAVSGVNEKDDMKKVRDAIKKEHGVEIALFGRMVAADPTFNEDASSQVAHSISTHKVNNEYDFYTAVDDIKKDDSSGAGMMGTVEYNSATFYRYSTIALTELKKQLGNDQLAAKAVTEFVRAFVMSMPSGKQNTFANRTLPYAVYIAVRTDQPVNLSPAFESPVVPDDNGGYNEKSAERLVRYEADVVSTFVEKPAATWVVGHGLDGLGEPKDFQKCLDELSDFVSKGA